MSSTTHHLSIHSLSLTSKPLLTVVDQAYPCSLLQLHNAPFTVSPEHIIA